MQITALCRQAEQCHGELLRMCCAVLLRLAGDRDCLKAMLDKGQALIVALFRVRMLPLVMSMTTCRLPWEWRAVFCASPCPASVSSLLL